jgi:hypothetical protein
MKSLVGTRERDVLSDLYLLHSLRVRTTVYCRSEMHAPSGFGVEIGPGTYRRQPPAAASAPIAAVS